MDAPDDRPSSHDSATDSADGRVPKRLWSATVLQVAGRIWGSACTFVGLAVLARTLEPTDFGRFTFYLAAFALLDAWADLGTGSVVLRRAATDRWATAPALMAGRRIRIRLGATGFAAVTLLAFAAEEPDAIWIAAAALYPVTHAWELSATVFKDRLAWGIPVAVRATAATLRLLAILALVWGGVRSAGIFLAATALASASANLLLHRASAPLLPKPTIPVQPSRGILAEAWPLGLALLCQQGYFYADNLFVRAIEGTVELGYYNAAVRVLSVAIMIAQFAGATGLPWLARRDRGGDLAVAARRLARPLYLGSALACGLLAPFAEDLLVLVFGESFAAAGPAMQWLLPAVVAIHAGAVHLTAVVASGNSRAVLAIAGGGLLLNLALNAWWVPLRGIEGAAAATAATEVWVALASAATVMGRSGRRPTSADLWWLVGPLLYFAARTLAEALR